MTGIEFLVRVRAGSGSENPDPIHNNIRNHNSKVNTGRKLNNTVEKFWDTYLGRERGATDPKQKRNPNLERITKTRLSVDCPVDRPMCSVDRHQQRATIIQSFDRAVDRDTPVHVVHTGRPGGRPAFSTGRPRSRPGANLACFNAQSCSFVFRSLCYPLPSLLFPLSPYISLIY